MPQLTLRFDGNVDHVLPLLDSISGRYLATRENVGGENEHVHVFLDCSSDKRAVRKRIQRSGHWTGNAQYSCTECYEADGWLQYICKGEGAAVAPVVLGRQGFTDDDVRSYHEKYYLDAEAIAEARRKKKKLNNLGVVETVLEEARNSGLRWTDREAIAEIYISKYAGAMKGINVFHARSVLNTVCVLLDPEGDAKRDLVSRIVV